MRKFITIDLDTLEIIGHGFPATAELVAACSGHFFTLESFEQAFSVTIMSMQSGSVSWLVVSAPIDSFVRTVQGVTERGGDIEVDINAAFATLTKRWQDEYLPPEE